MREADVKEVWESHMFTPYRALFHSLNNSDKAWTVLIDNVPVGMMGVSKPTLLSTTGIPWLLGTEEIVRSPRLFLIHSRNILNQMKKGYKKLQNYISVENTESLTWLKHLGFQFGSLVFTVTGAKFVEFYMRIE